MRAGVLVGMPGGSSTGERLPNAAVKCIKLPVIPLPHFCGILKATGRLPNKRLALRLLEAPIMTMAPRGSERLLTIQGD